MTEDNPQLKVYVLGPENIHVGLTGRDEAPIALIIPESKTGLGFTMPAALDLHDKLCRAIASVQDDNDEDKLLSDFSHLPKNKLNQRIPKYYD